MATPRRHHRSARLNTACGTFSNPASAPDVSRRGAGRMPSPFPVITMATDATMSPSTRPNTACGTSGSADIFRPPVSSAWGFDQAIPVPGDYDGDGIRGISVSIPPKPHVVDLAERESQTARFQCGALKTPNSSPATTMATVCATSPSTCPTYIFLKFSYLAIIRWY